MFTIILKVFGIYLIKDVLLAIPPVIKNFYEFLEYDPDVALFSLIFSFSILALHSIIVYFLLFKTRFLILKLNLTAGLTDQPLTINLHRSQRYTIAILITGILILVFSIPMLVKHFYGWFEYVSSREKTFGTRSYDYSYLLISVSEVLIGLLFLGNQQALVNFIEYKRRKMKDDQNK